jgi:DNA-binding LacI/PurR family transcriptional regulator
MPVISLLSPCRGRNTVFLSPNEQRTGRAAVVYLNGLGHRRIAHCTYTREAHAIRARRRGYELEMRKRGLRPLVLAGPTLARLHISSIREKGITALFCHNDWLALSAIRALAQHGFRVPADVSVLGVDNSPSFAALYPDITTMEYPADWIARQVARVVRGHRPERRPAALKLIERKTAKRTA